MPSSFENAGLGMFGSERRFMSQGKDSPLRFLAGALLKPKENAIPLPPHDFATSSAPVVPEVASAPTTNEAVMPPVLGESTAPVQQAPELTETSHPDTENLLKDLGFEPVSAPIKQQSIASDKLSGISPDVMKVRDSSQDQIPMQMASAPPPQLNLPQYGKQGGGGGDALKIMSTLASFLI
jgi:hypothetical protein